MKYFKAVFESNRYLELKPEYTQTLGLSKKLRKRVQKYVGVPISFDTSERKILKIGNLKIKYIFCLSNNDKCFFLHCDFYHKNKDLSKFDEILYKQYLSWAKLYKKEYKENELKVINFLNKNEVKNDNNNI